jgi:hypothetical protein
MLSDSKSISKLVTAIVLVAGLSVFYQAVNIREPVSPDYNLPLARLILSGGIWHPGTDNPYLFFPASSNLILALFVLLRLPINLFGLAGGIMLFVACLKLGSTFGLKKPQSLLLAAAFCLTTSVVRTLTDQSVDKWLAVWFIWAVILLEKPKLTIKHSLYLGLAFGMLVGTKYSGPLFALAIFVVYAGRLYRYFNLERVLAAGTAFTATGLIWYIRNWFLTGNPLYPAHFLFFEGFPGYSQQDWMLWKIPLMYPAGIWPLVSAYLSEYLIWALAFIPIVWFVADRYRRGFRLTPLFGRLMRLIAATGAVALFLPITTPYYIEIYHTISDMRYIYVFVLLQMLAVFLLAREYKMNRWLTIAAVVNMPAVFSFIPYYPKLIIAGILAVLIPDIYRGMRNKQLRKGGEKL